MRLNESKTVCEVVHYSQMRSANNDYYLGTVSLDDRGTMEIAREFY